METPVNAEYTIEKNVPMPPRSNGTEVFTVLDRMKVSESVLFAAHEWKRARNQAYIRHPKKFTFRKVNNGYRCWRTQ